VRACGWRVGIFVFLFVDFDSGSRFSARRRRENRFQAHLSGQLA
jgi:hypothetical protein